MQTLDLVEGRDTPIAPSALSESLAVMASRSGLLHVEFPTPLNQRKYVLRPTNLVGLIPIGGELLIRISPKVPVTNLFGMLEAVHALPSLRFYAGVGRIEAIEQIYERLAAMLARGVLFRIRRGLHSDYIARHEELSVMRGRLDIVGTMRLAAQGSPRLRCAYQLRTIDVKDNQILLWTLDRIPRLGLGTSEAIDTVRAARRALIGSVSLVECTAQDCEGRQYNRLNADYEPLHALARFFLERMGPGISDGDRRFIPFTVNMYDLFQEYVVACLRRFVPPGVIVHRQHRVELIGDLKVEFQMDAVLAEERTGRALAVIDAKYKRDNTPQSSDVQQVVAYCAHLGAERAFLVYPHRLAASGRARTGANAEIEVSTIGLPLDGDLELTARQFANEVVSRLPPL